MKRIEIDEYDILINGTTVTVYDDSIEKTLRKDFDTEAEAQAYFESTVAAIKADTDARTRRNAELRRRRKATFKTYERAHEAIVGEWGYPESMVCKYGCNECGLTFWAMPYYLSIEDAPACPHCDTNTMVYEML